MLVFGLALLHDVDVNVRLCLQRSINLNDGDVESMAPVWWPVAIEATKLVGFGVEGHLHGGHLEEALGRHGVIRARGSKKTEPGTESSMRAANMKPEPAYKAE